MKTNYVYVTPRRHFLYDVVLYTVTTNHDGVKATQHHYDPDDMDQSYKVPDRMPIAHDYQTIGRVYLN